MGCGPISGCGRGFFVKRRGDRLEPARPAGDRATCRAAIGRKSSATVPRVLEGNVDTSMTSVTTIGRSKKFG